MSFLRDFFRVLELSDESDDEVDARTRNEPESKRRRTEVASASGISVSTANATDVVPVDEKAERAESNRFADGRSGDERFHSALYFNKLMDCVCTCGNLDSRLFHLTISASTCAAFSPVACFAWCVSFLFL